jgi:hypothetical protein
MIYEAACAFFSKEIQWHVPNLSDDEKPESIKPGNNTDTVYAAVSSSYSILGDDMNFRKIVSMDAAKRRVFFDDFRNNYPKRFEFCNYTVDLGNKSADNTVSVLSNLGFKVINK